MEPSHWRARRQAECTAFCKSKVGAAPGNPAGGLLGYMGLKNIDEWGVAIHSIMDFEESRAELKLKPSERVYANMPILIFIEL